MQRTANGLQSRTLLKSQRRQRIHGRALVYLTYLYLLRLMMKDNARAVIEGDPPFATGKGSWYWPRP